MLADISSLFCDLWVKRQWLIKVKKVNVDRSTECPKVGFPFFFFAAICWVLPKILALNKQLCSTFGFVKFYFCFWKNSSEKNHVCGFCGAEMLLGLLNSTLYLLIVVISSLKLDGLVTQMFSTSVIPDGGWLALVEYSSVQHLTTEEY